MTVVVIPRPSSGTEVPLTSDAYDLLVDAGMFEGRNVELLKGRIVEMSPQGPKHSNWVTRLNSELAFLMRSRFDRRYLTRSQNPMRATDTSTPAPDISVIEAADSTDAAHPRTALLAIEVSVTSHDLDLRTKPELYAAAAVPTYWVIDLVASEVVVHTDPYSGDESRPAGYGTIRHLPLDTELDVLGIPIRLSELLD